jgi:hypothetical protein
MFFSGFKLQPEKITARKKNVQLSGRQLETGKNPEKKGTVISSCWLEGKTQNTTHIKDTRTNKMSREGEESGRVASPTRINLPGGTRQGYPAQPGLTWRNPAGLTWRNPEGLPSATRINLEEPGRVTQHNQD